MVGLHEPDAGVGRPACVDRAAVGVARPPDHARAAAVLDRLAKETSPVTHAKGRGIPRAGSGRAV